MKKLLTFWLIIFVPIVVFSQTVVKGFITDKGKNPVEGATVKIKNTRISTLTDSKGFFRLRTQKGKNILMITYPGMQEREVYVGKETDFNIVLNEKPKNKETERTKDIEEVVLIGYGQVNKKDITGSISTLKPDAANANQANGIENLIQGRTPGVIVNSQGFEPGAPVSVQIRGINSLTSNTQPLYVIDGIVVSSATEDTIDPLTGGSSYLAPQNGLQGIDPRDIESIEILKDASATAIYGSRGSNGVILVTTKKGKSGRTRFSYNNNTKVSAITRAYDVLNGREYAMYQNQSRALKGFAPSYNVSEQTITDATTGQVLTPINWTDEIYRVSLSQNNKITASGGNDNNTFYISAAHSDFEGIVPRSYQKGVNFNLNLTNKLTTKLTLTSKIGVNYAKISGSKATENIGGSSENLVRQIISAVPYSGFSLNFADPTVDFDNALDGPRAWITDYDDIAKDLRALGSFTGEYKFNNVFTYKMTVGLDYRRKLRQIWYGTGILRGAQANGEAGYSTLDRFRYNIDNTLMFKKKFNDRHSIDGTVGFIIDESKSMLTANQAKDFPLKDLRADGISTGQSFQNVVFDKIPENLISYLGRLNYNLMGRYNFTATFRADGSSKFAPQNRYSFFPAFAFAWQLHKESFLSDVKSISEAKIRLGWGQTGNQGIRAYQTLSPYGPTENYYSNANGAGVIALIPTSLANPNLIWETTRQYNGGLDLSLFSKRLTLTFDYFDKKTKDLLQYLNIGPSAGFTTITANQGSLANKGFEFSLAGDIIKNDDLNINIFGNFSRYRNKIVDLGLPPSQFGSQTISAFLGNQVSGGTYFKVPANIFIEGQQAALFWGFQTNGIISHADMLANAPTVYGIAPQLGDLAIVDQNGDGLINDRDRTVIGNPNPDFTYGFGINATFKKFTLNVLFNGVYGNDIANGNRLRDGVASGSSDNIIPNAYYNAWSAENPNGDMPRLNYTLDQQLGFTDRIIEKGSFLRLSNITLAYNLELPSDSPINSINFSVAANNLLLFTKYTGFDPEVNSFAFDPLRKGIDWSSFPNLKSYSFGINVNF